MVLISGDADTYGVNIYIFHSGGVEDAGADFHGGSRGVDIVN